MGYNAKEYEVQEQVPAGQIAEGAIIDVKDGKIKDFVENTEKFKNIDQSCINVTAECVFEGQKQTDSKIFTYIDVEGKMKVQEKSNLGKFLKYYKKLPEVGDKVQMKTNAEGFFRIVFE